MKKRSNIIKLIMLGLTALLVFTGCTDPVLSPEEHASRGSITIRIGESASTRSINPVIEKADTYEFSFERTDGKTEWPVPETFTLKNVDTEHKIDGVHIGTYRVTVKGYNASKALIMEGKSVEFTVSAGKDTPVSVQLSMIVDPLQKGNMKVVFDWSGISVLAGPLKDAVDEGTLMLKVVNADEGVVDNWPAPVTVTEVTGKTSAEFNVAMPVRDEAWNIKLELCNASGTCFYDFPASATIRSNVTSVPVEGTLENCTLTENPEGGKGPANVWPAVVNKNSPETSVDIRIATYPGASSISFRVTDQNQTVTYRNDLPVTKSNDVYVVDGLAVGSKYDIAINVKYKNGLSSGWKTYAKLQGIMAKTPVAGVTLVTDGLSYDIDTKNALFTVKANLNPLNATIQTGSWIFSDNSVFLADGQVVTGPVADTAEKGVFTVNLTPSKPGKTTVTIKSDETFERADISAVSQEFIVRLASPVSVAAARENGGLGITVTWNKGDEFASKYEIYRKTDAEYSLLETVFPQDVATESGYSYTDNAIVGGTSYSYQVVAVHESDVSLNSKPTAIASPVVAPRLADPLDVHSAKEDGGLGITVTWTKGDDLAFQYKVYRKTTETEFTSVATVPFVSSTADYSYTDKNLVGGTEYTYQVVAELESDASFSSNAVSAAPVTAARLTIPVITGAALQQDKKGILLTWTDSEVLADTFIIDRAVDGVWTDSWKTVTDVKQLLDADITAGKNYKYRISAKSSSYTEGDFTSPKSAESTSVLAKMATPANTAAVIDEDGMGITVSWNEGEGSVASTYIVARNVDGTWTENYGTVAAALSFNDENIALGKTYEYRVSAANDAYGETFNSEASIAASVEVAEQNNTITVLPPTNGATITLTDKGSVKVVTEETPLTINIAGGIPGATTYRWTLDGMILGAFTGSNVKVTYADCVKANPDYVTRNTHVLAVQTDNGVSATYRFNTEFFIMNSTALAMRLPLDVVTEPIYIWAESHDETPYTLSVVGATVDGVAVQDTDAVATLDGEGVLTVNGFGDITIKATAEDGKRSVEQTFSFYDNTLPSGENAVNEIISAVNKGILPTFQKLARNFEGDWWLWNSGNEKVTYGESEAYRNIAAGYAPARFMLKNVSLQDVGIGAVRADSNTIYVGIHDGGAVLSGGSDWLETFGTKSDGSNIDATKADASMNTITVQLSGNQGSVDICYMNQQLRNPNTGNYYVRFSSDCGTIDGSNHQFKAGVWSESIANNASITTQIQFNHWPK